MKTLPPETLGDRLRRLRRDNDLTSAELAERAGCDQSTVTRLEHGGNVTLKVLQAVAGAFGLTPAALLDGVREDEAS
ncbi:MAG: helix-turn-helix domain-containing protein [Candidatus Dormibacteria bacterium]